MDNSKNPETPTDFESSNVVKFDEMRLKRTSPKPDGRNAYEQLKIHVSKRLLAFIDSEQESLNETDFRPLLLNEFNEMLREERIVLNQSERRKLIEDVLSEVLGPDSKTNFVRSNKP
jgi:hypothetical protein